MTITMKAKSTVTLRGEKGKEAKYSLIPHDLGKFVPKGKYNCELVIEEKAVKGKFRFKSFTVWRE